MNHTCIKTSFNIGLHIIIIPNYSTTIISNSCNIPSIITSYNIASSFTHYSRTCIPACNIT